MLKKLAENYRLFFSSVLKAAGLLFLSLLTGLVIVYPLWKWALSAPRVYTICMLSIAGAALTAFLTLKIIKTPVHTTVRRLLQLISVLTGITLMVHFVLSGHTAAGILTLFATLAAFSIVTSLLKK